MSDFTGKWTGLLRRIDFLALLAAASPYILVGTLILVSSVLMFRACSERQPKLNQNQILRSQRAIALRDREEMVAILAESDAAEERILQSVENAKEQTEKAVKEAKESYANKTNSQLADELERRAGKK